MNTKTLTVALLTLAGLPISSVQAEQALRMGKNDFVVQWMFNYFFKFHSERLFDRRFLPDLLSFLGQFSRCDVDVDVVIEFTTVGLYQATYSNKIEIDTTTVLGTSSGCLVRSDIAFSSNKFTYCF